MKEEYSGGCYSAVLPNGVLSVYGRCVITIRRERERVSLTFVTSEQDEGKQKGSQNKKAKKGERCPKNEREREREIYLPPVYKRHFGRLK